MFGPVDHNKPHTLIKVRVPCVIMPLRRARLPVGIYEIQGDVRDKLRSVRERRMMASGLFSIKYITPETLTARSQFQPAVPIEHQEVVEPRMLAPDTSYDIPTGKPIEPSDPSEVKESDPPRLGPKAYPPGGTLKLHEIHLDRDNPGDSEETRRLPSADHEQPADQSTVCYSTPAAEVAHLVATAQAPVTYKGMHLRLDGDRMAVYDGDSQVSPSISVSDASEYEGSFGSLLRHQAEQSDTTADTSDPVVVVDDESDPFVQQAKFRF